MGYKKRGRRIAVSGPVLDAVPADLAQQKRGELYALVRLPWFIAMDHDRCADIAPQQLFGDAHPDWPRTDDHNRCRPGRKRYNRFSNLRLH